MNRFPHLSRTMLALLIATGISLWVLLAPVQIGGWTSYVIVNGNSMEPLYHKGDLVVLRETQAYQVGDVVTYRNPDVGPVIHRIIGRNGDRWIIRGDHNTWIDSYQPQDKEIIGRAWFALPGFGNAVRWLRQPLAMGTMTALATVFFFASLWVTPPQTKQKRQFRELGGKAMRAMNKFIKYKEGLFLGMAVVACLSAAGAVFAFSRPTRTTQEREITYMQEGAFSYTAKGSPAVYDTGVARPGEPVFQSLSCNVTFQFSYHLLSDQAMQTNGRYQLEAEVRGPNGWLHRFPLQSETVFNGQSFQTSGVVDICQEQERIEQVQNLTGVEMPAYKLAILPKVTIGGQIGGQEVKDQFSPELLFQLDRLEMVLIDNAPNGGDPLKPTASGQIKATSVVPNTMLVLNKSVDVLTARWVSVAALMLALAGIAIPEYLAVREGRDEVSAIQQKYSQQIIQISPETSLGNGKVVDVKSIDDLAKIAERSDAHILARETGPQQEYWVVEGSIAYRYTAKGSQIGDRAETCLLERDLHRALENGEFEVYYQPIVSLKDGQIHMVEALVRWQHPALGLLGPAEFLPIAQRIGMGQAIDFWVLKQACAQMKAWQGISNRPLYVMVNLSLQTALSADLIPFILANLEETRLEAQYLCLDISTQMPDIPDELRERIMRIKQLGIHVSLDDFSSYRSSETLDILPSDEIKINRSLFQGAISDVRERLMACALIRGAHDQNRQVIAEGVETEEQYGFLKKMGFDQAQGYWFYKPAPAEQVTGLLAASENRARVV
jgi:signal peptidase I